MKYECVIRVAYEEEMEERIVNSSFFAIKDITAPETTHCIIPQFCMTDTAQG